MGSQAERDCAAVTRGRRATFRSRYNLAVRLPSAAGSTILDDVSETKMDAVTISGSPKALVKGIALVDIVAASSGPVRQSDLVEQSGLPRPTAVRLLDALRELGLLDTDAHGDYRLGAHVAMWGLAFRNAIDISDIAADVMQDLSAELRETCYLGVRDGDRVLYLGAAHGPQAIRPAATVGASNPLYCTGIGKALLAFLPAAERDAYIARTEFVARTANTVTDRESFVGVLDATAARGYAIDDIENEEGIRCIAVPIRDASGAVVAGMSISAPAYRFSLDDLTRVAPHVVERAAELSRRLGYTAA
jgi:IclR family acetate operon transcriptional repressor